MLRWGRPLGLWLASDFHSPFCVPHRSKHREALRPSLGLRTSHPAAEQVHRAQPQPHRRAKDMLHSRRVPHIRFTKRSLKQGDTLHRAYLVLFQNVHPAP